MYLLVGLGNIGKEYELTRHNFGFLLLDEITSDYKFTSLGKKFKSEIFAGEIGDRKIIALKPHTFMNLSGEAVVEAARFYKIETKNILVLHDEVDLELARVKVKVGGGNGGHNGLKSIDEKIGKHYMRLRLGVGRPPHADFDVADYVLGKFTLREMMLVEKINKKISSLIGEILDEKFDVFLNKFYL